MPDKTYTRLYEKDFNFKKYLLQLWSTYCVFVPIVGFFYKIKIIGRENIPQHKKVICAPNHISFLDPFLVFLATKRPMSYMAKYELFSNKFMCWALPELAAFAVNRQKLEVSTIKTVKDVMKTKHWNLCIFPQGGIFRNKKIEKINRGFVVIAKMSKTDILPMSIVGIENYNWVPFKGNIIVKIGEPISFELPDKEIIDEWGRQVSQMSEYEYISDTWMSAEQLIAREKEESFSN